MKKRFVAIVLLLGAGIIALWGCGGGPGSPGSTNTEDTGLIVEASIIPLYLGNNTSSVDVVRDTCDPGPPVVVEPFTTHQATATITARLLNPNAQIAPGTLFIEKYTIEYRRSNDSIGAPPVETFTGFDSIAIVPPTANDVTTVTLTTVFFDLARKSQYLDDMTSGQFPIPNNFFVGINNYTAIFTFEGKNAFGKSFSFKAQTSFEIGDFDNCQ